MKLRRSERMAVMTEYLLNNPHKTTSLNYFAEEYQTAKSSISEDLTLIKGAFEKRGIGRVDTITGANGGVIFTPTISYSDEVAILEELRVALSNSDRVLPGGYLYLSDLLSTPKILKDAGRIIAKRFENEPIDVVMTVATKGVPLANAVANILNVPFVIVRRDLKITEGSTVSVNYASGSSDRIEKMFLSKRSLKPGSRVLIVDDFLKGGGTVTGIVSLLKEFESELVGVVVFAENASTDHSQLEFQSLLRVSDIDAQKQSVRVEIGSILQSEQE